MTQSIVETGSPTEEDVIISSIEDGEKGSSEPKRTRLKRKSDGEEEKVKERRTKKPRNHDSVPRPPISYKEITEPIQLPIRIFFKTKEREYTATMNSVDENQEVNSVTVDPYDGTQPREYSNLSAAARSITNLATANGWKKWKYVYKGTAMCVGRFRKNTSRNSRIKDSASFTDPSIRPSGMGFLNPPEGELRDMEQDRDKIACFLDVLGTKKLYHMNRNLTVTELLNQLKRPDDNDHRRIKLVKNNYEVDPNTHIGLLASENMELVAVVEYCED
jgi:hypothetical protein